MPIHDRNLIKKLRYKGAALRRNPSKIKLRFCEMIAKENNLPLRTVRYYMFERKPSPTNIEEYNKEYDLKYKKVVRHIDTFLPQVFNGNPELSLRAISDGIDNLSGVSLKERTLEKLLLKYEGTPRGQPIIKTETGNYCLNDSFYKN